MKSFHFILPALCIALALTSCNTDSGNGTAKPEIKAETFITIPAEGGLIEIPVTVENPVEGSTLEAYSDAEWFSDMTVDGSSISFNSLHNDTGDPRTAVVTLTYPDAEDLTITTYQDFTDLQGGGSISASMDPISLGCTTGDSNTLKVAFGGDWYIKGTDDWFSVTPQSGEKGSYTLTIEAIQDNTDTEGRTGTMTIASGSNEKQWTIVQLGTKGFYITDQETKYTSDQKTVTIRMRANTEEFTFSPDNMIQSYSIKFSGDYEEIGDTGIYSDYLDAVMTLELKTNPDMDNPRSQDITVSAGTMSQQISITQPEGKWDTPFYKNSLLLKFTSTGCQFCPFLDEMIEEVMSEMPDRLIPACCYSSALNGTIVWDVTSILENYYSINTYPSAIFNSIAYLKHSSENGTIIKNLINEALESYKSYTTIAATSSLSGDNLTVDIDLTAKKKGNYSVNVWVLENGIIKSQVSPSGSIPDYEHNHVCRLSLTGENGRQVSVDSKSTESVTIEGKLTSDITDRDNAYLVIFVTYPGNPTVKGVSQAAYNNYNKIVDNAFTLPLNGSIDIRYED